MEGLGTPNFRITVAEKNVKKNYCKFVSNPDWIARQVKFCGFKLNFLIGAGQIGFEWDIPLVFDPSFQPLE